MSLNAFKQKSHRVRFRMIRSQARSTPIQPIIQRYLNDPKDFQNNQRLLQIEGLLTETSEFNQRQVLNFAIVKQIVDNEHIRKQLVNADLERRSSEQFESPNSQVSDYYNAPSDSNRKDKPDASANQDQAVSDRAVSEQQAEVVGSLRESLFSSSSELGKSDSIASNIKGLSAELIEQQDTYFKQLLDLYDDKDEYSWQQGANDRLFKLWKASIPGHQVHMQKMRVTLRASLQSVIDTALDYTRRTKWDTNLFDFRVLYQTECQRYRRIYYAFKSPPTVSDRDFYLQEHYRRDYPEPGMCTLFVQTLAPNNDELPPQNKRVRGNIEIIGFVFKPRFDYELNQEVTEVFFVTQLDICGSVPKWMTNTVAKSIPKSWFGQYEKECQRYQNNELKQQQKDKDNQV